jgi:hypothetical protein
MPTGVWRGLPKEFVDAIKEFWFEGPFFIIKYPRNGRIRQSSSFPRPVKGELDVRITDGVPYGSREKQFEEIRRQLTGIGVTYAMEERGHAKEHRFTVDPETVGYEFMQRLEDLARQDIPRIKLNRVQLRGSSIVLVEGTLSPYSLMKVDGLYDFDNRGVDGYIKGGNIKVIPAGVHHKNVQVDLKDATLEDAEKLMCLPVFRGGSMSVVPKTPKSDKPVEFIQNIGQH